MRPQAPCAATNIERMSVPEPNTGCWLWLFATTDKGYGRVDFRGKQGYAHRLSYEAHNGNIPSGMLVRHKCNTPACVNPDHLAVGTAWDNRQDSVNAGNTRSTGCVAKWQAQQLYSPELIESLRAHKDQTGDSYKRMSILFGINSSTIHRLITKGYASE